MPWIVDALLRQIVHDHDRAYQHPHRSKHRRTDVTIQHCVFFRRQHGNVQLLFRLVSHEPVLDDDHELAHIGRYLGWLGNGRLPVGQIGLPSFFGYVIESEHRGDTCHILRHWAGRRHPIALFVIVISSEGLSQRYHGVVILAGTPLKHPGDILQRCRIGEAASRIVVGVAAEQRIGLARLDQSVLHIVERQVVHHAVIVDHRPLQGGGVEIQHVVAHQERRDVLPNALRVPLFRERFRALQRDVALCVAPEPVEEETRVEPLDQLISGAAGEQLIERARVPQRQIVTHCGVVRRQRTAVER